MRRGFKSSRLENPKLSNEYDMVENVYVLSDLDIFGAIGLSPSGKAQDFDSCIHRFKSG